MAGILSMQQLLGQQPAVGALGSGFGKAGEPGGTPGTPSGLGSPALGSLPALARTAASDDNASIESMRGYVNPRRALWGGFLTDMANHFLSGRTAGIGGLGPQAMFGAIQNNQALEEKARNQAMAALQEQLVRRQLTEPTALGDGTAQYDPATGQWSVRQPPQGAASPFEGMGTSLSSWARQTIFSPDANPESPEYLAAWDELYGSKTQVDPTTGRTYEVRPSPPPNVAPPPGYYGQEGGPAGGRGEQVTAPKLSDTEAKAGEFLNRMLPAVSVMTELEQTGFRPSQLQWQAFKRAPDLAMSQFGPEAQRYFRAVDSFVRAKLRRESGAMISAQEYEDEGRGAIILPGMEGEVIGDVQRERIATLRGIRRGAGAELREDPELDAAIEELAAMLESAGASPAEARRQARGALSEGDEELISIPGVDL
jgi:hypothetical protein